MWSQLDCQTKSPETFPGEEEVTVKVAILLNASKGSSWPPSTSRVMSCILPVELTSVSVATTEKLTNSPAITVVSYEGSPVEGFKVVIQFWGPTGAVITGGEFWEPFGRVPQEISATFTSL